MVRRLTVILSLLMVAVALFGQTTFAGGWATITFENTSPDARAGEPTAVRFLVKQHGNNPVHRVFNQDIVATVHIRNVDSKTETTVTATTDKEIGYYNADVTFPTEGKYEMWVTLSVLGVDETYRFPVNVLPAQPAAAEEVNTLIAGSSSAAPAAPSMLPLMAVLGIGVLVAAGISVWVLRRNVTT